MAGLLLLFLKIDLRERAREQELVGGGAEGENPWQTPG